MIPDLTLLDYITQPLSELVEHPMFSAEAYKKVLDLSQLNADEIIDIHKKQFGGSTNG